MADQNPISANEVISVWEKYKFINKVHKSYPGVSLDQKSLQLIKDTFKSSIWKMEVKKQELRIPLILKVIKPLSRKRRESIVESKMYTRGSRVLQDFMPKIFHIEKEVRGGEIWIIMEYVKSISEQIKFTPQYFQFMIPALAKLHAATYNERFHKQKHIFGKWLPQYESREWEKERFKEKGKLLSLLDTAIKTPATMKLIKPHYKRLNQIIRKGPHYFPQLIKAGQSMTHNDLQMPNIGCHQLHTDKAWDIRFMDWEGAKFAPCWFDMVNLVGVFLSYRRDWKKEENEIVKRCTQQYAAEMRKHGIRFKEEPLRLYQMAYLQRILEKGLFLQLQWEIRGTKKAHLLPGYLDKIKLWSKLFDL